MRESSQSLKIIGYLPSRDDGKLDEYFRGRELTPDVWDQQASRMFGVLLETVEELFIDFAAKFIHETGWKLVWQTRS